VPESTPDVQVGSLIALIVDEGKDWKSVKIPEGAGVPASAPPTPAASTPKKTEEAKPHPAPSWEKYSFGKIQHWLWFLYTVGEGKPFWVRLDAYWCTITTLKLQRSLDLVIGELFWKSRLKLPILMIIYNLDVTYLLTYLFTDLLTYLLTY